MQLAVVAAGFTAGEADQLRRAMAAWKRRGGIGPFRDKLINGMLDAVTRASTGTDLPADPGIRRYGFPESHAASFAPLVYVSSWPGRHEPAAFACALLNSQPSASLSTSAITRGRAGTGWSSSVDVQVSDVDSSLEEALRLGLDSSRVSRPCRAPVAARPQAAAFAPRKISRGERPRPHRSPSNPPLPTRLRHWRQARSPPWKPSRSWARLLYRQCPRSAMLAALTKAKTGDYRSVGLTLRRHPLALLREKAGSAARSAPPRKSPRRATASSSAPPASSPAASARRPRAASYS